MTMKGDVGQLGQLQISLEGQNFFFLEIYEGWNFNSGNYLFTTDTK
jgi:hypothetical protein